MNFCREVFGGVQDLSSRAIWCAVVLLGAPTAAYSQPITPRNLPTNFEYQFDSVASGGSFDDPAFVDYWTFKASPGQRLVLEVGRIEEALDPIVWLFNGPISDQSYFAQGAAEFIDSLDPGYLAIQDDGVGPFSINQTYDPRLMIDLDGPSNTYTVIVASFLSGFFSGGVYNSGDGGDGQYNYRIRATVFTPAPPSVVGRRVFYNNSSFDGNEPAPTASDDNAVDPNKQAYLPGSGLATFQSCTNTARGINGIMVDIQNLPGIPTASDFEFRVGRNNLPATWNAPPGFAVSSVTVRPGAGVSGADRVSITFADGAIRNQWLQVRVLANAATGLAQDDVHYWGHLLGETDANTNGSIFTTSFADITPIRQAVGSPSSPGSNVDIDRNGTISFADISAMRSNVGVQLNLLNIP